MNLFKGWDFRLGLTTVLVLSVSLITATVVILDMLWDVRREKDIFWEDFRRQSILLTTTFNNVLADALYFSDVDQIDDIAEVVAVQRNITYVQVFGADGRLLTDTRVKDYPSSSGDHQLATGAAIEKQTMYLSTSESLEVATPVVIGDDVIGVAQFGFDTADLEAITRQVMFQHLWQGLILILLGIGAAYAIARYAAEPLQTLTAVARRIGGGELDVDVPVRGTLEIAELARAMDRMKVELKGFYLGMDQRVVERTQQLSQANQKLESQIAERQRAEKGLKIRSQENSRLYEELQASVEEMAVVDEVGRIITSTLNVNDVFDQFARELKKLVNFDRMNINIVDLQNETFKKKYMYGSANSGRPVGETMYPMGGQVQYLVNTGKSLVRSDLAGEGEFFFDKDHLSAGLRSSIGVPLISKGCVVGTLTLLNSQTGAFGDREIVILERLAKHIAPALENARLYEDLQQAREAVLAASRAK